MIDDDYIPGEGDVMPTVWWRVADHFDLTKRMRSSEIPGHPLIAFADEFTPTLRMAGPLYVNLLPYTAWDTTSPQNGIQRQIFETLTGRFPGMFSIVVGAGGPDVWLALRLTRLTDGIATALLEQHERYWAHRRSTSR